MPTFDDRPLAIAAFRHHIVAAALEAEDEGVVAVLQEMAATPHWDPDRREVRVSLATLWRWLALYRKGGLLALQPRPRKDRGTLRAFPQAILDQAVKLRQEGPRRSTRTILKILVARK